MSIKPYWYQIQYYEEKEVSLSSLLLKDYSARASIHHIANFLGVLHQLGIIDVSVIFGYDGLVIDDKEYKIHVSLEGGFLKVRYTTLEKTP